ncbi:hypothetical protein PPL_00756 [Heterostelium album PN500]|uniref:Uncharacterized protein n=1 Tax=Heterostelium pallidum (strain ATCC 26659 / Pp 5 / PN500) TaxID=670386 RepID=D3AXC5_HETP5|nr:hypothetical protein PPL_00756 [Heterostelium album PN500]EFA86194.1 hypothetical protein PPL_00756 [Heterostelium album PN500]|eukprot:XP_020438299.1 hypothetical protein PPL_00756 [Heterostelium album PN500]
MQNNNVIPNAVVAADPTIVPGADESKLQVMNDTDLTIFFLIRPDTAFNQYPDQPAMNAQKGSVNGKSSTIYEVSSVKSYVSVFIIDKQLYYNVFMDRLISQGNCLRFKQSHINSARQGLPRYFNAKFVETQPPPPPPPVDNAAHNQIDPGAEGYKKQ